MQVAEIKVLRSHKADASKAIADGLRGLAYSLRGNNDVSFRVLLLVEHHVAAEAAKSASLRNLLAPYWREFSWTDDAGDFHHGVSRIQLWAYGATRDDPSPAVARFLGTGNDGERFSVVAPDAAETLIPCEDLGEMKAMFSFRPAFHISTDESAYIAPGAGLYAFLVAQKHPEASVFRLSLPRKSKWWGGATTDDRYLLWKTEALAAAVPPASAIAMAPVITRPDGEPCIRLI
jgi:hypothetical protein